MHAFLRFISELQRNYIIEKSYKT